MIKKVQKVMSLVFCAVIVAVMLTACGSNSPDQNEITAAMMGHDDLITRLNETIDWWNDLFVIGYDVEPYLDDLDELTNSVNELGGRLSLDMSRRDLDNVISDLNRLSGEIAELETAILEAERK